MSWKLTSLSREPHLGAEEVPADSSLKKKKKKAQMQMLLKMQFASNLRAPVDSHAQFVFLLGLFLKLQKC